MRKINVFLLKSVVIVIPFLIMVLYMMSVHAKFPLLDQWDFTASHLIRYHDHTLTLEDFYRPFNGQRFFLSGILLFVLALVTKWNISFEMLLTIVITILLFITIIRLLYKTKILSFFSLLVASFLVFSPAQQEIWLMGMNFHFLIPILCLTTSFVLLTSSASLIQKSVGSFFLSIVSAFSSGVGVITFLFTGMGFFIANRMELTKNKLHILFWIMGWLIILFLFFYKNVEQVKLATFSEHLLFFFAQLGLAVLNLPPRLYFHFSVIIGAFLFFFSNFYVIQIFLKVKDKNNYFPWLALMFYCETTVVVISINRAFEFGADYALQSRYSPYSIYYILSFLFMLLIFLKDERNKQLIKYFILIIGMFVCFYIVSLFNYHGNFSLEKEARNSNENCIRFIHVFNFIECQSFDFLIASDPGKAKNIQYEISTLIDLGYFSGHFFTYDELMSKLNTSNPLEGEGNFDAMEKFNNGRYLFSGWGKSPHKNENFDVILITLKDSNNIYKPIAIAEGRYVREEVSKILGTNNLINYRWSEIWSGEFDSQTIGVAAWGFNYKSQDFYKLPGEIEL